MNRIFNSSQLSLLLAITACLPLVLTGCGGGGGGGGGGSSSFAPNSSLTLQITDAPVDGVSAVVIEFTKVQVKPASGNALEFVLAAPKQIDLLQLTNGKSEYLLDDQSLPAGEYEWIRLFVDEANSYVTSSTGNHSLEIPSNAQSGLKVNRPFTLTADGVAGFVIDFDLRKSLHLPSSAGSAYKLRPTLRMVSATVVGGITGTVGGTLFTDPACTDLTASGGTVGGAVYVYSGADVTPSDVYNPISGTPPTGAQPLTTALVDGATGQYTVAYLEPGQYTVAFTCQSSLDDPATTGDVVFQPTANVTVASGSNTAQNFP